MEHRSPRCTSAVFKDAIPPNSLLCCEPEAATPGPATLLSATLEASTALAAEADLARQNGALSRSPVTS